MAQSRKWISLLRRTWAALLVLVLVPACSRGREYELRGQILAVDTSRSEITIKHEDIKGFMPGMTMPFKVRDAALLEGRAPGDLIRATLVVEDAHGYLKAIERTGHAPVTERPAAHPPVAMLEPGDEVPDVALIDESGATRRLSEWRGRTLAITFIYTRCPLPDFCPLMDRQFADVQQLVTDDESLRGRVHLLSISFDPSYDTPAVLAAHTRKVGAAPATWSFLTGDEGDVASFAGHFGVSIMREGSDPGNVVHNLRTAIVDANGRLVKVVTGMQWSPAEFVTDLRSAVGVK
jgi:protein SCO1/2